jgi:N-acetylglutamate synthase-like GNAT family acetyltransferase
MSRPPITVRSAAAADLEHINVAVGSAVASWSLPERVKRLARASYRYDDQDLSHMTMLVAEGAEGGVVGVAAIEPAVAGAWPDSERPALLHGLYVHADRHRSGIGRALLEAAAQAAAGAGYDALVLRANGDASGFFERAGLMRIPQSDAARDYVHRFRRRLRARDGRTTTG